MEHHLDSLLGENSTMITLQAAGGGRTHAHGFKECLCPSVGRLVPVLHFQRSRGE